jgi:hypothetical protein
MVKTTSEITIIDNDISLMLHNKKNGGLYTCNKKQNRISFSDSNGNKTFNYLAVQSLQTSRLFSNIFERHKSNKNLPAFSVKIIDIQLVF